MPKKPMLGISYLVILVLGFGLLFGVDSAFAETYTVRIPDGAGIPECEETNECYVPNSLQVRVGDTIIWNNLDIAAHTVTSGSIEEPSEIFDSSFFMPGETFVLTFDEAGEYPYFCTLHPWMIGLIMVQEAEAEESNIVPFTTIYTESENRISAVGDLPEGTKTIWLLAPIQGGVHESFFFEDRAFLSGVNMQGHSSIPDGWGGHSSSAQLPSGQYEWIAFSSSLEVGLQVNSILERSIPAIVVEPIPDTPPPDTIPPVVVVPNNMAIQATSNNPSPVTFSVSASDDTDGGLTPTCSPASGSNFLIGVTTVTCTATDTAGNSDSKSFIITITYDEPVSQLVVPSEFKTVAGSWANGQISDYEFLQQVQIRINQGTMVIPGIDNSNPSSVSSVSIPSWIKNNAGWWADGSIDDDSFVQGIEFLFVNDVLPVLISSEPTPEPVPEPTPEPTSSSIVVTTDKASYSKGDIIQITGEVSQLLGGYALSLTVISPNGNLVFIEQVTVGADKKFSSQLDTGETTMKAEGTYTIITQYGDNKNNSATTSFRFEDATPDPYPTPCYNCNSSFDVNIPTGAASPDAPYFWQSEKDGSLTGNVKISNGDTIVWKNADIAAHTVTSGTPSEGPDGIFDSGLFSPGKSFSYKFEQDGTYPYFCMVHPWMVGEIIVGDGGSTPTPVRINVKTDRNSYHIGDELKITGVVRPSDGSSVLLQIFSSSGNLVYNDRIKPSSNGAFTKEIKLTGSDYRDPGVYTVKAISKSATDKVQFLLKVGIPDSLPDPEPTSDSVRVSIPIGTSIPGCEETDSCFSPYGVRVNNFGTVTWINEDTAAHTVTSGSPANGPSGVFDSSLVMADATYAFTFERSGVYDYFCMVHPWMTGFVIVGDATAPPRPDPTPDTKINFEVITNKRVYDLGEIVEVEVEIEGVSGLQRVAIDVTDPRGNTVVSRSLTFTSDGEKEIEFRISEGFKTGTYKITVTTSDNGKTIKDTTFFKIKSQFNSFKITSVTVTDQQGRPSDLEKGELGFIKVNLESSKSIATLITVNIFDADLTSIGIGSVQTTLSSGNSEIILSFMIPADTASGPAEIFVNAFSDWPSNGGIPLTGEFSIIELIGSTNPPSPPPPTPEPPISIVVTTDMSHYDNGDTIIFSGNIINYDSSSDIGLTYIIKSPDNNIVSIAQLLPKSDGTFSDMIIAGGALWKLNGEYTIDVSFGSVSGETKIIYTGAGDEPSTPPPPVDKEPAPVDKEPPPPSPVDEEPTCGAGTELVNGICQVIRDEEPEPTTITVNTDKTSYSHGENILVKGQVEDVSGFPVTATVVSPLNSLVTIDQLIVANDGSFGITYSTTGAMWKYDGTYTIKVNYGSAEKSNKVQVELTGGVAWTPNYSTPTTTSISVHTDDNHYDEGDTIVVSGNVSTVIGETPIVLQIFIDGTIIEIVQITVAQDGTFTKIFLAEGPLWKESGEYLVKASYQDQIAETEFNYSPKTEIPETTAIFEVDVENRSYDVEYSISGGDITNMMVDYELFALIVQIISTDEGTVTLDLPRDLIDAEKQDGKDDTFIILIDGIEVPYQESDFDFVSRVITINFEEHDSEIKILGTVLVGVGSNSPPTPNVSLTNPRITNAFGIEIGTAVNVSQQIQVGADVTNHSSFYQDFIFHMIIRETGDENWISGSIPGSQSSSPSLAWTPTDAGIFTVEISVFDNIQNKNKLTDSVTLQIRVN